MHYEKGSGVKQDYAVANTWLKKSAMHHMRCGAHDLGKLYAKGLGVTKNPNTAMDYYKHVVLMKPNQTSPIVGDAEFSKYNLSQAEAYATYMVNKSSGQKFDLTEQQIKTSQQIEQQFVKMC